MLKSCHLCSKKTLSLSSFFWCAQVMSMNWTFAAHVVSIVVQTTPGGWNPWIYHWRLAFKLILKGSLRVGDGWYGFPVWPTWMVVDFYGNVGKYAIHGSYGVYPPWKLSVPTLKLNFFLFDEYFPFGGKRPFFRGELWVSGRISFFRSQTSPKSLSISCLQVSLGQGGTTHDSKLKSGGQLQKGESSLWFHFFR